MTVTVTALPLPAPAAYQQALHTYLNNRLPADQWHRTDDLAAQVWTLLRTGTGDTTTAVLDADGLPGRLAATARTVLRRHLAPAPPPGDVDWPALTQILGRPSTWPDHWTRLLAHEGQAALLAQAVVDLAADTDPHLPATAPAALAA